MSDMKRIVTMANQLKDAQDLVTRLEDELSEAKRVLRQIEREDLPMLMAELGISELKLEDGSVVSVKEDCECSITERTREPALRWLAENGFGGLIKVQVVAAFGRGERDEALKVFEKLAADAEEAEGTADVSLKEDVHASTLKAFVREQISEGKPLPLDLFNVVPFNKATIKSPTKKGK